VNPRATLYGLFFNGPQFVKLEMVSHGQAVNADMDSVVESGEARAHFLAHDEVWNLTQAIEHVQAALDRIVLGDRDEVHPSPLRCVVDLQGLGIAV